MMTRLHNLMIAAVLAAVPAAAQESGSDAQRVSDPAALASAAKDLAGMASDRLLIKDLLGQELAGPDGNSVGTIEDLVVVPGGRVVAALVETSDGTRLAIPFAAVKLASAADGPPVSTTLKADEIKGMSELKTLAQTLGQ
jgi:PRC-barrel domain